MEIYDKDKVLCNLTFEEYVIRKRLLQAKLKAETIVDSEELQKIDTEINELRERANYLNNLKMQDYCEKTR